MHLTPAGLPPAIPGKGDEIDSATQQAPHPERQFIGDVLKGAMVQRYEKYSILYRCPIVPLCR